MIKVFFADVSNLDLSDDRVLNALSPQRRDMTEKISNPKQKILSAGAGLLLAPALAEFGINSITADIDHNQYGKPYLKHHPGVYFSLSHSENIVMCAVADSVVGCDVQYSKCVQPKVAKRFFTPNEQSKLSYAKDMQDEFTRIWVLKESYVKYLGLGISACPLTSFDIDEIASTVVLTEHSFADYRAAICCDQSVDTSHIQFIKL